jgi:hypothetical protein
LSSRDADTTRLRNAQLASKLWKLRFRGVIFALNAQPTPFDVIVERAPEETDTCRRWLAPPDEFSRGA